MKRTIDIGALETPPIEKLRLTAGQFIISTDWRGKVENGIVKSNGYSVVTIYIASVIPIIREFFPTAKIGIRCLDDLTSEIKVFGNPTGVRLSRNNTVEVEYSAVNLGRLENIEIQTTGQLSAGIIIEYVEFKHKPRQETMPYRETTTLDIGHGQGVRNIGIIGIERPHIAGNVTLKGTPTPGAVINRHADDAMEIIIPTDKNGIYKHYMPYKQCTLTATSAWFNHNSIIREFVRPTQHFSTATGSFIYTLQFDSYRDFLDGYTEEDTYIRFKKISDNQSTTITAPHLDDTMLLCLECEMQSESGYDWFSVHNENGQMWRLAGQHKVLIAISKGQRMMYSKDGSSSTGFDTVRFHDEYSKAVKRSKSMATEAGYLTSSGGIATPNNDDMTSDYYDVAETRKIAYTAWVSNPTNPWMGICFYDSQRRMVGSRIEKTVLNGTIDVPREAAFVRISARYLKNGFLEIKNA